MNFLLDQLEEIAQRFLRWRHMQESRCDGDPDEPIPCSGLPVYIVYDRGAEYFYCDACVLHEGVLLNHHYRLLRRFR